MPLDVGKIISKTLIIKDFEEKLTEMIGQPAKKD